MQKVKTGDIFLLGNHRLLCNDARNKDDIKKLIGKDKIDVIISDVPYGINLVESKNSFGQKLAKAKDIENDEFQSDEDYRKFTKEWLEAAIPHLEKKNSIYIFNCDKMIFPLREGMQDAGIYFSQLLIWIKSQAVIGRKDYLPMHELIAYGWHGTHNFHKGKDKSVLFVPKPSKSKLHPTMKPVSLIRRIILNSTKIGDVVFDSFGGSGTCLIACEQTKRKCLIIEIDPGYCETIIERFEKYSGIKAKKLN
jgi:site-specific DNA-methyltransferase (adenine-specific)